MFYDHSLPSPLLPPLSSPLALFHALTTITRTAIDGKVDGITNSFGDFDVAHRTISQPVVKCLY